MFADNLKKYRIENGLSQNDLAEKLYVTRQCISKWEKGVTEPDIDTLKKIAELFGVSVDSLIGNAAPDNSAKFLKYNSAMTFANLITAIFCLLAFLAFWRFLPDMIPAHWTNGVLDRYGSRN